MSITTKAGGDRPGRVAMIGSDEFDVVVLPVATELKKRGIEAIRFDFAAVAGALPEILHDVAVFYGPGALPVTATDLDAAPQLRALVSFYTGTEGFDEAAASARNILVANGQVSENTESMAEAGILLILAALYDLAGAERAMHPNGAYPPRRPAVMLRGKTVGLIGFGQIGRAMAARLEPWGAHLLITTPHPRPPFPTGASFVSLDVLLQEADVICVLAPLKAETVNLLNSERLAATKRGAILVNISRGKLVDEQALYSLAAAGHFAVIALDVFATEPLPADSPLRTLPNAILTPHAIGHTSDSTAALISTGVENICRALEARVPLYVRNPEILPRWLEKWSGSDTRNG